MEEEDKKQPVEQRRLKIRGGSVMSDKDGEKKEAKEKETGSKMWVFLVLFISVIFSLIFSFKGKKGLSIPVINESKNVEDTNSKDGGLFGPAVYEFGK